MGSRDLWEVAVRDVLDWLVKTRNFWLVVLGEGATHLNFHPCSLPANTSAQVPRSGPLHLVGPPSRLILSWNIREHISTIQVTGLTNLFQLRRT